MAFQVSPGVNVSEIDLTAVVPAVAVSTGAIGGVFSWGPINKYLLIDSEDTLALRYGKPTADNFETFFSAANFLSYAQGLYVSRAANTTDPTGAAGVLSAVANSAGLSTSNTANMVLNSEDYETKAANFDSAVHYIARYPGALGNSLKVSVCDSANAFQETINMFVHQPSSNTQVATNTSIIPVTAGISIAILSTTANVFITSNTTQGFSNGTAVITATQDAFAQSLRGNLTIGDFVEVTDVNANKQKLKIKSVGNLGTSGNSSTTYAAFFNITFESTYNLASAISSNTFTRYWEFHNLVDVAPDQTDYVNDVTGATTVKDELHIVVVDQDGKFTGVPGQVLEVYQQLSRATDAKNSDGTTLYYKNVINEVSDYVWAAKDRSGAASNTALTVATSGNRTPLSLSMVIGSDGANETSVATSDISKAYDLFKDSQSVDIGLIIAGKARGASGTQVANYIIDNVAEVRKDCVVFISPEKSDVFNVPATAAQNIVDFRNTLRSTSYAVLDSGYKYQYDKYNDVYRYVPLNGDIAGITARSDNIRDPWFSPAGFNRGTVKNLVKLAFNPTKTDRDTLYKSGINPVVTFPGQGTVLYGDKTLLAKPSAFDRINVRRLFIVLEKSIANAANSTLFEFNDEFTRLQFLNLIEPFLRDVQGRRGITDFRVVCDETNNTSQVVDSNRFVGDIYIKPARSINFIQLNFVAVRSGVEFSEIVGQF